MHLAPACAKTKAEDSSSTSWRSETGVLTSTVNVSESRMSYTTLVSTRDLLPHLRDPDWAVVDCRFSLNDPGSGPEAYVRSHIPGAVYAHLDEDLSGPIIPGKTGRHPLPSVASFVETLSSWGIDDRVQVVAYDGAGGSIAARLWWMLRWLGHLNAAVLDGGWPQWKDKALPTKSATESRRPGSFTPGVRPELLAQTEEVVEIRSNPSVRLCDSRSPERFRGENETLDPVAGHIPGAISLPYADNLNSDGCFLSVGALRARFASRLGDAPAERIVLYCGSGVTAAHNVLAIAHAGLGNARLYAGSWSEWITDPRRPVERD